MTSPVPTLALERALLAIAHAPPAADAAPRAATSTTAWVVGMDEVGRGALAGPVCVGAVAVDGSTSMPPPGLRDSKLLTAPARQALLDPIAAWAPIHALGWASAAEIDACGIVGALRRAGQRALAALPARPIIVLLDGKHDWLTEPAQGDLFSQADRPFDLPAPNPNLPGPTDREEAATPVDQATAPTPADPIGQPYADWTVVTRIKADRDCASVAAASVLAKCARDAHMVQLASRYPAYGWAANKGYGSADHLAAIGRQGLSREHRASWRIGPAAAGEAKRAQSKV